MRWALLVVLAAVLSLWVDFKPGPSWYFATDGVQCWECCWDGGSHKVTCPADGGPDAGPDGGHQPLVAWGGGDPR